MLVDWIGMKAKIEKKNRMRWNIFRTNRSQNRTVASAAPAAPNGGVGGVGGAGNPSASRRRGRLIEKAAAEVGDVEAATSHRLSRKPRPPHLSLWTPWSHYRFDR